ncbi:hypothetical protein PM8797T_21123 [Gimesia maris DSM 8797]|nr:hypothetical protein PM8797T_21123 [Gimesia maris DSM 8797]
MNTALSEASLSRAGVLIVSCPMNP